MYPPDDFRYSCSLLRRLWISALVQYKMALSWSSVAGRDFIEVTKNGENRTRRGDPPLCITVCTGTAPPGGTTVHRLGLGVAATPGGATVHRLWLWQRSNMIQAKMMWRMRTTNLILSNGRRRRKQWCGSTTTGVKG